MKGGVIRWGSDETLIILLEIELFLILILNPILIPILNSMPSLTFQKCIGISKRKIYLMTINNMFS